MSQDELETLWVSRYHEGVPRHIAYPELTLDGLFAKTVAERGEADAVIFLDQRMSWSRLGALAQGFAEALTRMGLRKGDRVVLLLPNCPQMVAGFFGTLLAGGIVVPVNPLYVEREIEEILRDSGARFLLALDRLEPRIVAVQKSLPELRVIYTHVTDTLTGLRGMLAPGVARRSGNWRDTTTGSLWKGVVGDGGRLKPGEDQDAVAVLQYTGGTTGTPKGAMLTHRNLVANAVQTAMWTLSDLQGKPARVVGVLPLFHVYGLTVVMTSTVVNGGAMILLPRFDVDDIVEAIRKYHPELFPGTPTMYVGATRAAETKKVDMSSVRVCTSGSAPLPKEVQDGFEKATGAWLVEGYGLTEASPVTHCNPLSDRRKIGTIGVPYSDTYARVVADDGTERGPDEGEGELWVKGPQVMKGYWEHPDETANVLTADGWLKTGDVAAIDADGHFRIVDRKKDLIIAGGFNIYPREVEDVLYGQPAVAEAAVFGVPDPYRGQTVKAAVVFRPGLSATEEELVAFCNERLARYKVPTLWEFCQSLPKSTIGKTLRRVLLDEHLAQLEEKAKA